MTASLAPRARAAFDAEKRGTRSGTDPIIVLAMAIGFLLTSLTTQGSQSEQYDLPSWLQTLQPIARPGAIGFLLIALVRYLIVGGMFSFRHISGPAWIAWVITLFLLIKIYVLGGNLMFFLQATFLAVVQISLLLICVSGEQSRYGNSNQRTPLLSNFEAGVFIFSGLFAGLNVALLVVAPQAVSTWFGRFYGVTANPQHTMMICVLCIPFCVLVWRTKHRPMYERAYALVALLGLAIVIFNTGSRTGFIGGFLVLAVCYSDRLKGKRLAGTLFGAFSAAVGLALVFGSRIWTVIFNTVDEEYIAGREDTRTYVWQREFSEFIDHWQFGVPLEEHGRLNFAETYWISVASNGGIFGLVFVMILLGMLLYTIQRLTAAGLRSGSPLRYRIYASASLAVLILSVVESILAGLIVAHTMLSTGILATAWNLKTPRKQRKRKSNTLPPRSVIGLSGRARRVGGSYS